MEMFLLYKILLSSIFATLFMTLFSYLISEGFRKLYKEPVLLTYFLDKLKLSISLQGKTILAWILHFIIGFIFVLLYHLLWTNNILKLSWENGILLGAISGVIGIIGWVFIFDYTNYEPKIDFKGYFIQLFIAHVIFGFIAYLVYSNL